MVKTLDTLEPDAVCIGNHEFDFGAPRLQELMQMSSFPWLGNNIFDERAKGELLPGPCVRTGARAFVRAGGRVGIRFCSRMVDA